MGYTRHARKQYQHSLTMEMPFSFVSFSTTRRRRSYENGFFFLFCSIIYLNEHAKCYVDQSRSSETDSKVLLFCFFSREVGGGGVTQQGSNLKEYPSLVDKFYSAKKNVIIISFLRRVLPLYKRRDTRSYRSYNDKVRVI